MVIERDNFIVETKEEKDYIDELVNHLESEMITIMDFFELGKLSSKKRIIIYDDVEEYKKHIEQFFEYHDYMCADTNDGNINLLSLEAAHKTNMYKNMTLDEIKGVILHEFVHICQQEKEVEHLKEDIAWFWEALATNLGNPKEYKIIKINASNKDIEDFNSNDQNYPIAYTIGKYMLENYSHEEILDYIKYPTTVLNDSDLILNNAREWSNKKNKIR